MLLCAISAVARDFTYEGIIYTVLDENAKTVETKAGYKETVDEETTYYPGNVTASSLLWLTSKVYDGDTEYTLTRIGEFSFSQNQEIWLAVVPESVDEIGKEAFSMCLNLYGLTMPDECSIEEFAFYGCISLASIELPNNLVSINSATFAMCLSLKNIEIPASVTEIELAAFMGSGLEQIALPDGVTNIGMMAFANCTKLEKVYLPFNLSLISMNAFSSCEGLKTIYYNTNSPALMFENCFDEDTYDKALLYVNSGMKSVMESKYGWQNFKNIIETDLSGVDDISIDSNTEYYDINGMRLANPLPGQIVIKRSGNKIEKIKM